MRSAGGSPCWPRTAASALLLAWVRSAEAQVFHLGSIPTPEAYSLSTHYMFYVYSKKDSPVRSESSARVKFERLLSRPSGRQKPPGDYEGVQVSLLPYADFWKLIDKEKFCSTFEDVRNKKAAKQCQLLVQRPSGSSYADMGVTTLMAPFDTPRHTAMDATFEIEKTGAYVLTYSNCGNFSEAVVSGDVHVMNPHGYLPANEYYTMQFFAWVAIVYTFVCVTWLASMLRYLKALLFIQKGIATIVVVALIEVLCSWYQYWDWNNSGERGEILFATCLLFYTLKYILSWRLVLICTLGAGVTLEELSTKTSVLFFIASVLFMLQQCIWKLILSYRYSHALQMGFLMLITLPGIAMNAVMFVWAFVSLASLLSRLEEQKLDKTSKAFRSVRCVLCMALLLSTAVLSLQVLDFARGSIFPWEFQFLTADGAPHAAFLMVLLGMMCIWWPTESNWKFGYAAQGQEPDDWSADAPEAIKQRIELPENDVEVRELVLTEEPEATKEPISVAPQTIGLRGDKDHGPEDPRAVVVVEDDQEAGMLL